MPVTTRPRRFPSKTLISQLLNAGNPLFQKDWPEVVEVVGARWAYQIIFADKTHLFVPRVTKILDEHHKPGLVRWKVKQVGDELMEVGRDAFRLLHTDPTATPADFKQLVTRLKSERGRDVELSQRAANFGTQVHDWIEQFWMTRLTGTPPPPVRNKEISDVVGKFLVWVKEHDVQPLEVEDVVYSLDLGYAGRRDLKARYDGKVTIIDWKTSGGFYLEMALQNSAYRGADEEMFRRNPDSRSKDLDVQQGLIVRLPKEEKGEIESLLLKDKDHEVMWPTFKSLVLLYHVNRAWEDDHDDKAQTASPQQGELGSEGGPNVL